MSLKINQFPLNTKKIGNNGGPSRNFFKFGLGFVKNLEAGFKIDAEWLLKDASGLLGALTVYNYKNGRNYNGAHAAPVEQITDWNVGGRGGASVALANALFGAHFTAA